MNLSRVASLPVEAPARARKSGELGAGGYVLMEEEHVSGAVGDVFLIALHWWDDDFHPSQRFLGSRGRLLLV